MKTTLILAGVFFVVAGIGTASGDEEKPKPGATLKEYTAYLLKTYGENASVTDARVNGKVASGEEFGDTLPSSTDAIETLALPWWPNKPACRTWGAKVDNPPFTWRYCANQSTSGYEMQRDHLVGASRQYSDLLDCENEVDMSGPFPFPPTPNLAKQLYCP